MARKRANLGCFATAGRRRELTFLALLKVRNATGILLYTSNQEHFHNAALRSPFERMRIGDRVMVRGLTGRVELNGVAGSVTKLAAGQNADRVGVLLDGYAEPIALRAECLQATKRPREPRSSLAPLLQDLVDTALQLEDRASPGAALARVRQPSRQLRVCAANVPPGLASNKIKDGVQVLTGVQSDEDGAKWHARRYAMATQLRAVGAGLVLHQA